MDTHTYMFNSIIHLFLQTLISSRIIDQIISICNVLDMHLFIPFQLHITMMNEQNACFNHCSPMQVIGF